MSDMYKRTITPCRVCGLFYPAEKSGKPPQFDICRCCGTQFGYSDTWLDGVRGIRRIWLTSGASWWMPRFQPENWNLEMLGEQLNNVPDEWW